MRITLISKAETKMTGLRRYALSLADGFREIGQAEATMVHPPSLHLPGIFRRLKGVDLNTFFASYPLRCPLAPSQVYHLTNQNLATLLLFQRIHPAVVTVHDIIPRLVRRQAGLDTLGNPADRLFYNLSLLGLRQAQAIIAISNYTRQTLIENCRIRPEKVHVVYRGIDLDIYRPRPVNEALLNRYGLKRELQYILYVGSEDPRKNLATLIDGFARVRQRLPGVRLLKVGAPHFPQERQKLLARIDQLGLQEDIHFLDQVPEEDLPQLYNAASIFVLPSWYEGFGLPALEAMACGVPAVVSDAASLPEVVGPDGLLFSPNDSEALAAHLLRLLNDEDLHLELGRQALARARGFSLATQAQATLAVYQQITGDL